VSRTQRELKALRQQQREEAAARQRARDRRNLFIIGGILGTAAVAILIVALALNHAAQVSTQNRLPFQTVSGTIGTAVPDEGRTHVDPSTTPTYKSYPPASGPHYSAQGIAPVPWQTIDTLQEGQYLHNLEHGALVVLYSCKDGCPDDASKQQLQQFFDDFPASPLCNIAPHLLSPVVARFDEMSTKYAAVVWDRILLLDTFDFQCKRNRARMSYLRFRSLFGQPT